MTVTDEAGAKTYLTYIAFGNPDEKYLVSVKDPRGDTVSYERNILGSLTKIIQGSIVRSFTYDSRNFLVSEAHPETGTISYTRDNVGNMVSKTDALGTKYYTYDPINRLIQINFGSNIINFQYDKADNRIAMTSPSASITYVYDSANRLTQKTEIIGGKTYAIKYQYDNNDNVTVLTYPSGRTVTYSYNSNNQVTGITGFGGSISNVTYNTAGLPTSYTLSNGLTVNITYNNRNLTTKIKAGTVFNLGYSYDSRGNTTAITDYVDSTKSQSFNYDSLNRLTAFNGSWGTGNFTYDAAGNRMSKRVDGTGTTSYNYSNNRLTSASGAEPMIFQYDNNGNITSMTIGGFLYALSYDSLNNLKGFYYNGKPVAEFQYDGDGMRITNSSDGKTIVYHYDKSGRIISENYSDGDMIAEYIYLNDKLIAKIKATPEILVTPSLKDFGIVELGNAISQIFTITNKGTAYLTINNINLTGAPDFSIKTDNCTGKTLQLNASCTVETMFTPSSAGNMNATLIVQSNDPDAPSTNITLTGTGGVRLTIIKSGNGSGIVMSEPSGISCGTDCSEIYTQITSINLTAIAESCSDFAGWIGEGCNGTGPCTVAINNKNIIIEAVFNYKPINADFTASPDTGGAPLIVNFTDRSLYCAESWLWDFGDGFTSTIQNPVHIYREPGVYAVTLTVTNAKGTDTETKFNYISVNTCQTPVRTGITNPTYFSNIQSAYNVADDGGIIQSIASEFTEDININRNITLTLDGGYDCNYTTKVGNTVLRGNISVTEGVTAIDSFMVK